MSLVVQARAVVWPRPAAFSGPSPEKKGNHKVIRGQSPSRPESRPIVHRPTETLDTLAILKGETTGPGMTLDGRIENTKQSQFRGTDL